MSRCRVVGWKGPYRLAIMGAERDADRLNRSYRVVVYVSASIQGSEVGLRRRAVGVDE